MSNRRYFGQPMEERVVEIPEDVVTINDLVVWDKMRQDLTRIKVAEALLRRRVFKHFFPSPTEGTNKVDLAAGYVLKGTYEINRDVDEGALQALNESLREKGIIAENYLRRKPELKVGEYRKLTKDEATLFDQVLIIKPGMPAIEIVPPKADK